MKQITLSPYKTYFFPMMKTKDVCITEVVHYGGEQSESVPCGFIAEFRYEKTKKRSLDKRLRAVANRVNVPSSTSKPHG